jgi:hypothetical protein
MSMIDPDVLLEKARQFGRSDDFLGEHWQPAFRTLTTAIDAEAGLGPARRERLAGELLGLLVTRSRIAALLRARPEIVDTPLPPPVVVTGLPRSGTTLLHNLLARVPGNRAYRLWEMRAPAFPPGAPLDQAQRELSASADVLAWLYDRAPGFRAIHPMQADAPDECNWLLRSTFTTPVFAWTNFVPSYDRWLSATDAVPAYREWRLQLQLLRWRSPGGAPVLKDPGHLWNIESLLRVCPDARVLVLERDLVESVPSLCSLCATLQSMPGDDPRDPSAVGRYVLDMVTRGRKALAEARTRHAAQILDVLYTDLVADPFSTVRRIQAWIGRPFDAVGEERCRTVLDAPRHPSPHRYNLEQFGLTRAELPA